MRKWQTLRENVARAEYMEEEGDGESTPKRGTYEGCLPRSNMRKPTTRELNKLSNYLKGLSEDIDAFKNPEVHLYDVLGTFKINACGIYRIIQLLSDGELDCELKEPGRPGPNRKLIVGKTIELHPITDQWAMGDHFARIMKIEGNRLKLRLNISGKHIWMLKKDVLHEGNCEP